MKSQHAILYLALFNVINCHPSQSECNSYEVSLSVSMRNQEDSENYFPEVEYPTRILDAIEPFYYHASDFDEIITPFTSDVKNAYISLEAEQRFKETQNLQVSCQKEVVARKITSAESSVDIESEDSKIESSVNEAPELNANSELEANMSIEGASSEAKAENTRKHADTEPRRNVNKKPINASESNVNRESKDTTKDTNECMILENASRESNVNIVSEDITLDVGMVREIAIIDSNVNTVPEGTNVESNIEKVHEGANCESYVYEISEDKLRETNIKKELETNSQLNLNHVHNDIKNKSNVSNEFTEIPVSTLDHLSETECSCETVSSEPVNEELL